MFDDIILDLNDEFNLRENNPQTSIGGVNLEESASEAALKSQIITKEDEERCRNTKHECDD